MDIQKNGQGFLRENLHGNAAFCSFVPTPLQKLAPFDIQDETLRLLTTCSRRLGELEGMLHFVPNADMYLAMYVRKEALLSAQIEGTQCTFDDIIDPERSELIKKDVADVVSYVRASDYAITRLQTMPLCTRFLREVHEILLSGTRGSDKTPGETRVSQNWIGPAGCAIAGATYIPPNIEDMNEALSELDKFINEPPKDIDPIIRAALIHYQFETIHPFLDGNGRLGRLLITLSLMNDGVLTHAGFYPSYQLKLKRHEYYERLMDVRREGLFEEWIAFFCECMLESADDAVASLKSLISLHDANVSIINKQMGRLAANGQRLLELLEGNPIVNIAFVSDKLGVSRTTAANLVNAFVDEGILVALDESRQRYRVFLYESYLAILRKGDEPL